MKTALLHGVVWSLLSTGLGMPVPDPDLGKREVPQEHSHDLFLSITREALNKNNPKQIQDVVFGLLGNKAAAGGAGQVKNLDCLQQETADQAFTNAKAARDVRLMAGALVYRALERNTGKIGLASVQCTQKATNPEVAAIQQHQDPASANAGAINKEITLHLAKQLKSIGADPELALLSGTFAPSNTGDNNDAGNGCDTPDAKLGCIFQPGRLVLDATRQEVATAVAAIPGAPAGSGSGQALKASDLVDLGKFAVSSDGKKSTLDTQPTKTQTAAPGYKIQPVPAVGDGTGAANIQSFSGALGGPAPPVVSSTGPKPFTVDGDTFLNAGAALTRSCDIQHNTCADAANSGKLAGGVGQCDTQNAKCKAAIAATPAAPANPQQSLKPSNPANPQKQPVPSATAPTEPPGTKDFGSCSDPSIKFATGLDGRNTAAFAPNNPGSFQHGSALNIGVIADFICGQLKDKCKAGSATVAKCQEASTSAKRQTGADSAATFNRVFGV